MRFSLLVAAGASAAVLGAAAQGDPAVAAREDRLAAAALLRQNEALRQEVDRLRGETARLTAELARAKAEVDELRFGRTGGDAAATTRPAGGAASVMAESWRITEVNMDLKLVVLEGGRSAGLRPGMMLYALRGEKPAARLRVADVREHIAGAVMEEVLGAGRPEKGDRAVLMQAP